MLKLPLIVGAAALISGSLGASAAPHISVQKMSISSAAPLQLQIRTSGPVSPQTQVISNPERLVIDIPNGVPGLYLRNLSVNRNGVKRVRSGLFSRVPLVTRIVVEFDEPQWYRIVPNSSGFVVSLGSDRESAQRTSPDSQPAIGWVSAKMPVGQAIPFVIKKNASGAQANLTNGVNATYSDGLLEIHSHNASLSEILFQIQKQTGAEIAIPAGTEQQRVAADFGPGPASEVLGELLNGSGLNFVVVGSEADPKILRSVILSQASSAPLTAPAPMRNYPPAVVNNIPPDDPGMAPPPATDESAPQQPPPPPEGGPVDPPPS